MLIPRPAAATIAVRTAQPTKQHVEAKRERGASAQAREPGFVSPCAGRAHYLVVALIVLWRFIYNIC